MGWLSVYFAGGGLPLWMTKFSHCFASERKTGKKHNSPHVKEVRLLYNNQPQPGQPFKIDFDGGFASVGHAKLRSHTRFPVSMSSSRTNLVLGGYTNSNFGNIIPTDARSIGASTQCSGKSRRRKRLQRKRRPYLMDMEMSLNSSTWVAAHSRQDMREPLSQSESGAYAGIHTPTSSRLIQRTAKAVPRPTAISYPIERPTTPPRRHPSDCSRYTVSRHSSNGSDVVPRSGSIYHKAVLALPRNTEYFLESLDEDLPAPLVPLKIRPLSKALVVPRRHASKKSFQSRQSEGDLDYVREWDQGWEDFDTMLDDYQKSFSDEEISALCAPKSYDLPETLMSASALERWRSRWSDDSSEMSNTQYKEVTLPPLAHLPDLESDSLDGVSNPSSPTVRGPNTPYLQTSFSPFNDFNASQSHISLCLTESRTPTSPRHHGGSHSLDSAQPKRLPHEAKHKPSASVSTGFPPGRHDAAAKTPEGLFDISIVQAEELAPPRYLEMHRRGGYEDLKHWPMREGFGTAF